MALPPPKRRNPARRGKTVGVLRRLGGLKLTSYLPVRQPEKPTTGWPSTTCLLLFSGLLFPTAAG